MSHKKLEDYFNVYEKTEKLKSEFKKCSCLLLKKEMCFLLSRKIYLIFIPYIILMIILSYMSKSVIVGFEIFKSLFLFNKMETYNEHSPIFFVMILFSIFMFFFTIWFFDSIEFELKKILKDKSMFNENHDFDINFLGDLENLVFATLLMSIFIMALEFAVPTTSIVMIYYVILSLGSLLFSVTIIFKNFKTRYKKEERKNKLLELKQKSDNIFEMIEKRSEIGENVLNSEIEVETLMFKLSKQEYKYEMGNKFKFEKEASLLLIEQLKVKTKSRLAQKNKNDENEMLFKSMFNKKINLETTKKTTLTIK